MVHIYMCILGCDCMLAHATYIHGVFESRDRYLISSPRQPFGCSNRLVILQVGLDSACECDCEL